MTVSSETTVRVRYAETDQMGVVYYANFFVWFEVARVELMRQLGFSYKKMEIEDDSFVVVAKASASANRKRRMGVLWRPMDELQRHLPSGIDEAERCLPHILEWRGAILVLAGHPEQAAHHRIAAPRQRHPEHRRCRLGPWRKHQPQHGNCQQNGGETARSL